MTQLHSSLLDSLHLLQRCPVCGGQYLREAGKVLEERAGSKMIHLTCSHCRHAVMALVSETVFGISSVGMLTDLDFIDWKRLRQHGAISEDELLSFHTFISKWTADTGVKSFEECMDCFK